MALDHKNHADMNILASLVGMIPETAVIPFAAHLLSARLMIAPWWLRGLHWMVCKVRGWDAAVVWMLLFLKLQKREFAGGVVKDFIRHIKHGKDLSDPASVGGLNQSEVDLTCKFIIVVLPQEGLHPTYREALA